MTMPSVSETARSSAGGGGGVIVQLSKVYIYRTRGILCTLQYHIIVGFKFRVVVEMCFFSITCKHAVVLTTSDSCCHAL